MKEYLTTLVRSSADPVQGRNRAREYLQARILGCLQEAGAMIPLAFHGGTALRFLHNSRRYSEDLDFALEQRRDLYAFPAYLNGTRSTFEAEGYRLDIKANREKTVNSAFLRFPGLLFELGLSAHPREAFSVKIEIDTRPPAGAGRETSIVRRHLTLNLQHHDRPSLLAGKLHAILTRPYVKGRDMYDLLWYFADRSWPAPNLRLLNNALEQTGWKEPKVTSENWRQLIRERVREQDWRRVAADVRPFLERAEETALLTRENLLSLLG